MIRFILVTSLFFWIIFFTKHNVRAIDKNQKPFLNNYHLNRIISENKSSSNVSLKWFIKAYEDSTEIPCFGWAGYDFMHNDKALIITNQRMYLYERNYDGWKTFEYRMPNEFFINGRTARNFCTFWTDKNIYIFHNRKDSLIVRSYIDNEEIPYTGYITEGYSIDEQALFLTNKRIYICDPYSNHWTIRSYETNNELPYGGGINGVQNALIWTSRGIYFSYGYGLFWNVTYYQDSTETPKYGGISNEKAYVATDKRIYYYYSAIEPYVYAYEDSNETPLGGGVHEDFVVVWTDKRIYLFPGGNIAFLESHEIPKGGGANQGIAHVRTNRNAYVRTDRSNDWKIQEYRADENYVGGDLTYILALVWTDKSIYLFDIFRSNWETSITFNNEEIPEKVGNNFWNSNSALVRTNQNLYLYNIHQHKWNLKEYINNDENPLGGKSKGNLALSWTDKTIYIYNTLDSTWSIQFFDSSENPQNGILGNVSAVITTDIKSYAYFMYGGWSKQNYIGNEEFPKGEAVSPNLVLSWTDKRIYLCDAGIESTQISQTKINLSKEYVLYQNYPNPFNPQTTIKYQLPKTSEVAIKIYNIRGQLVKTVIDQKQSAGYYSITWSGKDDAGQSVTSGVYFCRLQTKETVQTVKMLLIR